MFREKVRALMSEAMRRLLEKTPVNTGQAVMNYVASSGSPATGPVKQAGKAVEPTNKLALGQERLRANAEAISHATLANVDYRDPYRTFYIVNKAPHIGGLEYGALPKAPYVPRSPNGMFGVTVEELMALLGSGRI